MGHSVTLLHVVIVTRRLIDMCFLYGMEIANHDDKLMIRY